MQMTYRELKDEIAKIIPRSIDYEIDLEAGNIAIITTNMKPFTGQDGLIGKIARRIKRKIVLRTPIDAMMDMDEAKDVINDIIPEDADITEMYFDACYREVTIQCRQPGTAIGRRGQNSNAIRDKTGWAVKVERTPPLFSKTVHDIRMYRQTHGDERRKLLKDFGLNIHRPTRPGGTWARVTALGSYREVGRACHYVTTNESRIMIDVGVNIASDTDPMPFFNAPEALPLDKLDAVVLTHSHLDHAGMLPVLFKYGYRGPVYCTPPTRDLMLLLQTDYLKVGGAEGKRTPYDMEDIRMCMKHVVDVDWDSTTDIAPDVKLTFSNAGHILGSSAVHLNIADGKHNVVFSGDQKYEKSWLFDAANTRFPRVETLVIESTYGASGDYQPSRQEANQELQDIVSRTLMRGGKMICPVFAVGRSQEVMIAIDELFRSGTVKPVPVWLDGMIQEATAIHASHPNYLTKALSKSLLKDDGDVASDGGGGDRWYTFNDEAVFEASPGTLEAAQGRGEPEGSPARRRSAPTWEAAASDPTLSVGSANAAQAPPPPPAVPVPAPLPVAEDLGLTAADLSAATVPNCYCLIYRRVDEEGGRVPFADGRQAMDGGRQAMAWRPCMRSWRNAARFAFLTWPTRNGGSTSLTSSRYILSCSCSS